MAGGLAGIRAQALQARRARRWQESTAGPQAHTCATLCTPPSPETRLLLCVCSLVAAAMHGGAAAEEEDYDFEMEEEPAAAAPASQPAAQPPPQQLGAPVGRPSRSPSPLPAGLVPPAQQQQQLQLPADPQQAAAAACGLRLPVLGRAPVARGAAGAKGSQAVLRFSELFGSSAAELGPPQLLPHGERARQRAASQAGRPAAGRAWQVQQEEEAVPGGAAGSARDVEGDESLLYAADVEGGWVCLPVFGVCASPGPTSRGAPSSISHCPGCMEGCRGSWTTIWPTLRQRTVCLDAPRCWPLQSMACLPRAKRRGRVRGRGLQLRWMLRHLLRQQPRRQAGRSTRSG